MNKDILNIKIACNFVLCFSFLGLLFGSNAKYIKFILTPHNVNQKKL